MDYRICLSHPLFIHEAAQKYLGLPVPEVLTKEEEINEAANNGSMSTKWRAIMTILHSLYKTDLPPHPAWDPVKKKLKYVSSSARTKMPDGQLARNKIVLYLEFVKNIEWVKAVSR